MAINNYTLATKPYTRGFGDQTTTVVEIRLQDGNRYSTNQRELVGDRTQDKEDVLIQAVLDIVKAELDPGSAVVKTQQELVETKTKQDELQKLIAQTRETTTTMNKALRLLALNSAMTGIPSAEVYKELVAMMPPMRNGETYFEGDLLFLEDQSHVETATEGKLVFVHVKREFEYNGETVKQLEDKAIQEGNIAVYKWKAPTNNVDHI
jgi:putative uncharacterized protein 53|nr:MAG TPA: Protein of unknown function (DUF1366) [Caudoviricetes sp.]DAW80572.1 MAG TPA: Protein of unknown function (DUF1366) [Caudoviricetes sp.]